MARPKRRNHGQTTNPSNLSNLFPRLSKSGVIYILGFGVAGWSGWATSARSLTGTATRVAQPAGTEDEQERR